MCGASVKSIRNIFRTRATEGPRNSDPPGQADVDVESAIDLVRYFYVLPEPVALPERFGVSAMVRNQQTDTPTDDDPPVTVIFHQADIAGGRTHAAFSALTAVTRGLSDVPTAESEVSAPALLSQHTVVEAITTRESPDSIPEEDQHQPIRWQPRADSLTRCLALTDRVLRAHRQASETPSGRLTYPRAHSPVLMFQAKGVLEAQGDDPEMPMIARPVEPWGGGGLVMLDHFNLPDPFRGKPFDAELQMRFPHWLQEQERGNPLNLWRERFIEARRALEVTGDMALAVLLANTSAEVMLDALLALLLWEDGSSPEDVLDKFEEGKVLRRLTAEYPKRLKGSWSTSSGPVGRWYSDAYRLRHRVIHGGYEPTPRQAQEAIDAVHGLQRFVMDRLADRRTAYPRSALMTLAEEGLRRRNLWGGQIERFAREVAPTEDDWRRSFTAFHSALVDLLAPQTPNPSARN